MNRILKNYFALMMLSLVLSMTGCNLLGADANSIVGSWETDEIKIDLSLFIPELDSLPIDPVVSFTGVAEFRQDKTASVGLEFDAVTEALLEKYLSADIFGETTEGTYSYDKSTKILMINDEEFATNCVIVGDEMTMSVKFTEDMFPYILNFERID